MFKWTLAAALLITGTVACAKTDVSPPAGGVSPLADAVSPASTAPAGAAALSTASPLRSESSAEHTPAAASPSAATGSRPSASPSAASQKVSTPHRASHAATPGAAAPFATTGSTLSPAEGVVEIGWAEFFDDERQDRPSEKFWSLSEQRRTVALRGFMGEVFSFEKRWFLLIPAPGAECPFDNGDGTYWNKIVIVFPSPKTPIRFIPGPLKVVGRLDVGIKIDESGYKTMFRLYDAAVEKAGD